MNRSKSDSIYSLHGAHESSPLRALLLEDSQADYVLLQRLLENKNQGSKTPPIPIVVHRVSRLKEGMDALQQRTFDIALLDLSLPDAQGLEGLYILKQVVPTVPIVVLTGMNDEELALAAVREGAQDYLNKDRCEGMIHRAIYYAVERHRTLTHLEEAREAALAAADAKSLFLANMSHEIRTPLTAIVGYGEAIGAPDTNDNERLTAAGAVVRNSRHLLSLIGDILDMSKIEAGKLEVQSSDCSPIEIVSDIIGSMKPLGLVKNVAVEVVYDFPLPEIVKSDPVRLRQILFNLVSNAIKFTDSGSVQVRVSFRHSTERLYFEVIDSGIGIAAAEVEKLFHVFSQVNSSIGRKYGGTGLGLALSKRLVEMLGGEISVESKRGEGSSFKFYVATGTVLEAGLLLSESDLPEQIELTEEEGPPPQLSGKILICDDSSEIVSLMTYSAQKCGLQAVSVGSGVEALEGMAAYRDVDLILMDMRMPVMDGYTTVRQLRASGFEQPIIAVTASGEENEMERCIAAGCTAYLAKPFSRKDFNDLLGFYLTQKKEEVESTSRTDSMEQVITRYIKNLPGRVREAEKALVERNADNLKEVAHKLKSGEMFGFPELTALGADLDHAIKNQDWPKTDLLVQKLKTISGDCGGQLEGT